MVVGGGGGGGLGMAWKCPNSSTTFLLSLCVHTQTQGAELPVVIEVDGPTHQQRNDPTRTTGATSFKHRLLSSQRHRWAAVVSVSLTEWEPLGFSARRKQAFLEARLREAGVGNLDAYRFGAGGDDAQTQCALLDPEEHCSTEVLVAGEERRRRTAG